MNTIHSVTSEPVPARKPAPVKPLPKAFFTETEAAKAIGVSVEQFRELLCLHLAASADEIRNSRITTFHATDVLLLKMFAQKRLAPPEPG